MAASQNRSPRQSSLSSQIVKAMLLLFIVTLVFNIFYHVHLPNPTTRLHHSHSLPRRHRPHHRRMHREDVEANPLDLSADTDDDGESNPEMPSEDEEDGSGIQAIQEALMNKAVSLWASVAKPIVKTDKNGNILNHNTYNVTAEDLVGIGEPVNPEITMEQASRGKAPILDLLKEAGVDHLDVMSIAKLPTWQQVVDLYGEEPVVQGLDRCEDYRKSIPVEFRSIGPAGLFNTGTNPLAMYLNANCIIPENKQDKGKGMRWQVSWGKHMLASRKWTNTAKHDYKVNKTQILPAVLIRDPYSWMQSMCRHPYGARFFHDHIHCPGLVPTEDDQKRHPKEVKDQSTIPVVVSYPHQHAQFSSLAHLWSQWYNEYKEADYPRLMIRFEDMIFHPRKVLSLVCECAGAKPKQDAFKYVLSEGKWGASHRDSSNLVRAMIRYGTDTMRLNQMTPEDLQLAYYVLDAELMELFHYKRVRPDRQ